MNINKTCAALFFVLALFSAFTLPANSQPAPELIVFHSPSCHKCQELKSQVMPRIVEKFGRTLSIRYLDTNEVENYRYLLSLKNKYAPDRSLTLPILYMAGRFISGSEATLEGVEGFINEQRSAAAENKLQAIDLAAYFTTFKPLAVAGAGLVDGINPCAFAVIVFFISFLSLQGYGRKQMVIVGSGFIFAVFLTYLLTGVGLFSFLYKLNKFWLVTRIINLSIGALSIALGFISLYDLIKFKSQDSTQGLLLQLPQKIKERIHKIIGFYYRRPKGAQQDGSNAGLAGLLLSALVSGFLVSLLEAVCTGQMYLPTITFVLKTSARPEALGYLLLYNLMFVVPLAGVLILALLGVTNKQFSEFSRNNLPLVKALMAVVFFALGLFLVLGK